MTQLGRAPSGHLAVERLSTGAIDIDDFAKICSQQTDLAECRLSYAIRSNVPIYLGADVRATIGGESSRVALLDEWANCLANGAGVFVVSGAFEDLRTVDAMTSVFEQIIATERRAGVSVADHFAEEGANTRAWNVLQKCVAIDPGVFSAYYSNVVVAAAAEAWLGPWYQLSAQVNVVHPGGTSQRPHRDYHLGFQVDSDVARFPLHAQLLSQALTLQGAVAHSDMPIESGPTRFLPFSQRYLPGYMAWRDSRFVDFFEQNSIQLNLEKGDAVFFNPSLHHAAGANTTDDTERIANLLQITSAMGRPMETIDTYAIAKNVFPTMQQMVASGDLRADEVRSLIAATADGYSFPSNLDLDPPSEGMAPQTAQELMYVALTDCWSVEVFSDALDAHRAKRIA